MAFVFTTQIMSSLAALGPLRSSKSNDASILNGLSSAVELLTEATQQQIAVQNLRNEEGSEEKIPNNGRIVCFTSVKR